MEQKWDLIEITTVAVFLCLSNFKQHEPQLPEFPSVMHTA